MAGIFVRSEFKFLFLYFVLVFVHYVLPNEIGQILLISILVIFYSSKKDYFWLAFGFLISSSAAGFFSFFTKPLVIGPVPFFVAFTIVAIAKSIKYGKFAKYFYFNIFIVLVFYYSVLRFSTKIDHNIIKLFLPLTLLLVLPLLLKTFQDIQKFFHLLFAGLFIVFIGQWYHILTGNDLAFSLFGVVRAGYNRIIAGDASEFIRSVEGIYLSYMTLIGSTFFLSIKKKSRYYLIILLISLVSIWITATRGWMIASFVAVIPYFLNLRKRQISNILLVSIVFIILITQITPFKRQLNLAFNRLETVEQLVGGDATAGGTLTRLTDRHEPVWNKFLASPIFGWGWSDEYMLNIDPHVGNQNLLMNVGIIGFILFLSLIAIYLNRLSFVGKKRKKLKQLSQSLIFGMLGIVVIHSASRQMIGYELDFMAPFMLSILFTLANYVYYHPDEIVAQII